MLLKLEMKFAEPSGDPIKTCTILKCHRREGDRVVAGDPLFDIEVREVLIPSTLGAAWKEADFLSLFRGEIAVRVTRHLEGKDRERLRRQVDEFAVIRESRRQIVAHDTGTIRKLYSREGILQRQGEPMALLATEDEEAIGPGEGSLHHVPAFRAAVRDLGLDAFLNQWTERVKASDEDSREYAEGNYVIFWSKERAERRVGIYARGGCDLSTVKVCQPLIAKILKGTCCLKIENTISDARNDLLLQTLRTDLPWEHLEEVIAKLYLQRSAFEPRVFQKTFTVDGAQGPEEFPINAVILGNASDLNRTLYRHREHGFLVDPGSGWLRHENLERTLNELNMVAWFRRNFVSAGRMTVEEYAENLASVIRHIREASGAHVLVLNNLTVDPVSLTHNYQLVKDPLPTRRLEFKLALYEVSRKMNVPVVDVDRIVKRAGLRTMRDTVHFYPEAGILIGEQIFGILQDLKAFERR